MTLQEESMVLPVREQSQVGEARRVAKRSAARLGLDAVMAERAAIVATEAGNNMVQHASGGDLVLRGFGYPEAAGLELLALDRGRGIPDLKRAMQDGYSTSGTAGQGLGAMVRLSSEFDIYSVPGRGTAVLARVGPPVAEAACDPGVVCVPMGSEPRSGDGWAVARPGEPALFLVIDGLGHGPAAAEAAQIGAQAFRAHAALPLTALAERIHAALRSSRGAALAIAELPPGDGMMRWVGIGNIAGAVVGGTEVRRLVSMPGIAGQVARTIQAFEYRWSRRNLLVMHSDGLTSHWALDAYPGLTLCHPSLVAGVLHRDFTRGRDDATVLVARRTGT
jgi:anti-sigma regulatory factor (Ser/Thr protein kinase)